MKTIAIYGEPGSFTEQAALNYFGKAKLLPNKYISEVFDAVESGRADFGIVPIENTIEGAVTQTYDQLIGLRLNIIAETILRINHCLVANPGVTLRDVKRVYSIQQALGQCKEYLQKLRVETVPFYDTAGSVKTIRERGMDDAAAVASARAAKIYGMQILAKDIETNKRNFTRFLIVSRKGNNFKGDKTSLVFTVKNNPGSLYDALRSFADSNIDLTYIQSRPVIGKPWVYNFYVDFKGDKNDKNVKDALRLLKKSTKSIKILGSYKKAQSKLV